MAGTHAPGTAAGGGARPRLTVAGVAGGVGTTTVATGLGALDRGVFTGRGVDILVCRATGDSLVRAGRAAQLITADGRPRPFLAVTAADTSGPTRPVTARLRLIEPHTAAVVLLPFVRRWRELAVPLDEVRSLLTRPLTELPRPLRRYARALHDLRAATGHPPTPGPPTRPALHHAPARTPERTSPACAP
ncbi:hypothetical protein [Pseudonocardia lacus]|uniref:hypothetical protein n=1 Tax=Pseudonocardia lacus TaxID=2835865 RepID=UPI001BDD2D98|nr:hypothetical protein [Pseudonocardia lacus]